MQKHSIGTKKTLSASEINRFNSLAVSLAQGTFLPTRSNLLQLRDKEKAFCIRNKPFLFFSGFFCTGNVFCPLAVIYYSIGTKKTLSASEINRFNFLAVSFAQGTFFRPLAVQKHSFGTKKTLSASEINRFNFLAVSFAQGTFLPTRSAKAQHRDKENAFCIRNKPFLFFSGFFCTGNVFCPLAVIYYSFGTKKTII